jgi:hypothetical protein
MPHVYKVSTCRASVAELNLIGHIHQVTLVLNKCIDTMEQLKKTKGISYKRYQFMARLLERKI